MEKDKAETNRHAGILFFIQKGITFLQHSISEELKMW
jgi:hypothetical protein